MEMIQIISPNKKKKHHLQIETGRWLHIPRKEKICNVCNHEIVDELHFLLECRELQAVRKISKS